MRPDTRCAVLVVASLLGACAPIDPTVEAVDDGWDQLDWGKGDGVGADSYGALAAVTIPAQLELVVAGLDAVDEGVMPHEAKDLRKRIGKLRDFVDLFVYAYPFKKRGSRWAVGGSAGRKGQGA